MQENTNGVIKQEQNQDEDLLALEVCIRLKKRGFDYNIAYPYKNRTVACPN